MQKVIFKFLSTVAISALLFSNFVIANPIEAELFEADSLYDNKQYTQAVKMYESLFNEGYASPNMLLKLARINEGQADYGKSIFYLEKYFQLTEDTRILDQINKITSDNKIKGFSYELPFFINYYYQTYHSAVILTLLLFLIILIVVWLQKPKERKYYASGILALMLLMLFVNNYNGTFYGVMVETPGYIMSGPSAGADVLSEISKPVKLPMKNSVDVWIKTNYNDQTGYVKADHIKKL